MSTPDEPYRLSEVGNRRIFAEHIVVPDPLAGRESQPQPTTMVLLGQQGTGKTRISEVIAQRLNSRGGFVHLDSDLYKPYHPAYAELMPLDDRQMVLHVGPNARQWTHQARAYAQEHGPHVLAHDTAGDARFSSAATGRAALGWKSSAGLPPRPGSELDPLWRTFEIRGSAPGRMSIMESMGEEVASASPFVHAGVQGRDRRAVPPR